MIHAKYAFLGSLRSAAQMVSYEVHAKDGEKSRMKINIDKTKVVDLPTFINSIQVSIISSNTWHITQKFPNPSTHDIEEVTSFKYLGVTPWIAN
jgi:hypothetical protein